MKYDNASDLSRIEEFDKLVQVKELPVEEGGTLETVPRPPGESAELDQGKGDKSNPLVDGTSKLEKQEVMPQQRIVERPSTSERTKKSKKSKQDTIATRVHLPEIEDSEGFEGRRPLKDPFRVGEKMTFMMTYFGVSAGDMILATKPFKQVNGRKSYHFHVTLRSSDLFSLFYFVDDWGETFVDFETLLPASMAINATESKKLLAIKSVFDHLKKVGHRFERVVYKGERPQEKKIEWEILEYSQDVVSAFYYVRVFNLTPGKTIHFRVADDGKNMLVKVEILRKEKIKTPKGEFNAVVIKPTVEVGGIFQPMGNVYFWVSDDDRKIIVRIEAEIKIGKIIGQLKDIELGAQ